MDRDRLLPWVALRQIPGIGCTTYKHLMARFGTPEAAFSANRDELLDVEGVSREISDAVAGSKGFGRARKEIDACIQKGYRILTHDDPEFPPRLLQIHDPPPYLYAYGEPIFEKPAIAIVGTRNPSRYGITMAQRLSADLASMGFTVVSGMARGVDTAAHQGALQAGGRTIAVLGSGLSVIYPPENRNLYFDISRNGTIVSELPVSEPPNSYNFPARNRIISGITMGTLVVEAAQKSGSLITARLAAEQGREVFAVPGNANSFKSAGVHSLLKQGAKLVDRAEDVIEELAPVLVSGMQVPENQADAVVNVSGLTDEEKQVYDALDSYPTHIDELGRHVQMDTGALLSVLLKLELKGIVAQMPGKYFCISGV